MGVTFTDKFEFPDKRFFWASSKDYFFRPFGELNWQHKAKVDTFRAGFTGEAGTVLIKCEPDATELGEEGA